MSKAKEITGNPNGSFARTTKPKDEAPKDEKKVITPEPETTPQEQQGDEINVAAVVDEFFEEQAKKELKQDISGNYTLVIKHDIMERLDELAEHYPRGFKSELVNKALETFVSLYEQKELPPKRQKKRGRR